MNRNIGYKVFGLNKYVWMLCVLKYIELFFYILWVLIGILKGYCFYFLYVKYLWNFF